MKKAISLILTAALAGTLCAPALAAEAADARLTAVTQAVKATLGIDTESYDQFYGDLSENELAPAWDLSWSGPDGDLNVTATESGKVLGYDVHSAEAAVSAGTTAPAFPKLTQEEAQKTAQAFLDKVLEQGVETARFDDDRSAGSLGAQRYYFSGSVELNGLPSPLSFWMAVRVEDNTVTSFRRDDLSGQFIGGIPSAKPAVGADKAGAELASTLSLRLEYVLDDEGGTAVLRYLPNAVDEYYVDAQTGKLVDLTELGAALRDRGGGNGSAMESMSAGAADKSSLSQAEQQGVEKLEGVLDKEALAKKAQAIPELGLKGYSFAQAAYTVERQDKDETGPAKVTARLTFTKKDGDDIWRRYVTLDAKTGALEAVNSSMPWREDAKRAVGQDQAQKKAEAFLQAYDKDQFAKTALYDEPSLRYRTVTNTSPSQWSFTYARQENGYFYAYNSLNVSIDASDGSVSSFYRVFDEAQTFESPEGIVSAEAAHEAYAGLFDTTLAYIAVPQKLDLAGPDVRPLLEEMGYSYFYTLKLGYGLESNAGGYVLGIDAKTGEAVGSASGPAGRPTYDDLDGHWVKTAAEALAGYGIGWTGGSLAPDAKLSQRDLVALLVSVQSGPVDPIEDEAQADELYQMAYRMGILKKADRADGQVMTRLDIVRMLLDQAGYGPVAELQGIYRCGFADEASIPADYYGYAALAQGLKIVTGDGGGNFAPDREATRAEAVGMLYNFMKR